MRTNTLTLGIVIGGLAVLGYALRDHPAVARLLDRVKAPEVALPAFPGPGAKKCTGDGKVVYTSEACPAGMREEPVGGALSIVPPAPPPPASKQALPTRGERLNEAITRQ
jgi:hypothetical protein